MRKVVGVWIATVLLLEGAGAFACIGSGELYGISFRQAGAEGLTVVMRSNAGGPAREFYDDTGALSLQFALLRMRGIAEKNGGQLHAERDRGIVEFARARGAAFQAFLQKELRGAELNSVLPKVRALNVWLKKPTSIETVIERYQDVVAALREKGLTLKTYTRLENERGGLGTEKSFAEAGVPGFARARSMGCNPQIGTFNLETERALDATSPLDGSPALPDFSLDVRD